MDLFWEIVIHLSQLLSCNSDTESSDALISCLLNEMKNRIDSERTLSDIFLIFSIIYFC